MTYDRGTPQLVKAQLVERFGEEGLLRVAEKLNDEARDALVNPRSKVWYPTLLGKEIAEGIHDEFAGKYPDVMYDCGRYSAKKSTTGILRFLMRNISIEKLLKRITSFLKHFNKGGDVEVERMESEGTMKRMKFIIHG